MIDFDSKYTGAEVEALLDAANGKQDAIDDLDDIRAGAAKGATALQSVPSEYVTESELTAKGYATTSALNDKVDKVGGKGLSTEDFTTALKTKLEGLNNYNDTEISNAVSSLQTQINTLVSGNANDAINSFNEIIAFLDGIKDTQDLSSIIASIEQQIAGKQDTISDLATIRSGAAKGATALQSYTEKYTGTITGIKMNGASKGTSGVVDLGTVITAHQDISGKADKSSLAKVATSGSYDDLSNKPTIPSEQVNADWNATSGKAQILNKPTIPSAVTESTVSGWGFTKNTGTYSKPSGGIPKSDLASAVQTSLGKADTALQSYTEQYKGTVTGVKINGTTKSPSSGVVDLGTVITDISGKQDKLVSGTNIKTINGTSILGSGNITISGGSGTGGNSYAGNYKKIIGSNAQIEPNTFYIHSFTVVGVFSVSFMSITNPNIVNEYLFSFFTGSNATLSLPSDVIWANDDTPVLEGGYTYTISVVDKMAIYTKFPGNVIDALIGGGGGSSD